MWSKVISTVTCDNFFSIVQGRIQDFKLRGEVLVNKKEKKKKRKESIHIVSGETKAKDNKSF